MKSYRQQSKTFNETMVTVSFLGFIKNLPAGGNTYASTKV